VAVFLRGTCKSCGKPFFTKQRKCPTCRAAVEGVYWLKFRFEGRRIEESTHLTNLKAAERFEQRRREDLRLRRAGLGPVDRPPLFEEYAEKFLACSKTSDSRGNWLVHRPATQVLHAENIKTLKRYFGGLRLDEITPAMIEDFKQRRIREPRRGGNWQRQNQGCVSGTTVNRALTTLSLLYERAAQESVWFGRNPARSVQHFPEQKRQRILSFEEQERYLKHAGETVRDIMILMTEMGFRPQDLMELEVGNVQLVSRTLNLWPLRSADREARNGKTPESRRSIPITDAMLPIIMRRLDRARELRTSWLFPSPRNPQKHIVAVRKAHYRALKKAGIEDRVRVYDLRHTGLTRLHESGVQDLTLMRIAGHTTLQMTARYIRISDEAKLDAVRKLQEYKRAHAVVEKAS
jgi:site-specific recombinase XerD